MEATVYSLERVVRDGVKKLLASLSPNDEVTLLSTRRTSAQVTRGADAITGPRRPLRVELKARRGHARILASRVLTIR